MLLNGTPFLTFEAQGCGQGPNGDLKPPTTTIHDRKLLLYIFVFLDSFAGQYKFNTDVLMKPLFALPAIELKEQLLARSSRVDDIEQLKQEFSQQRRELQKQNEVELENLRTYFEQRLRASEENHREEIALLQRRLAEGALEESVLKSR